MGPTFIPSPMSFTKGARIIGFTIIGITPHRKDGGRTAIPRLHSSVSARTCSKRRPLTGSSKRHPLTGSSKRHPSTGSHRRRPFTGSRKRHLRIDSLRILRGVHRGR